MMDAVSRTTWRFPPRDGWRYFRPTRRILRMTTGTDKAAAVAIDIIQFSVKNPRIPANSVDDCAGGLFLIRNVSEKVGVWIPMERVCRVIWHVLDSCLAVIVIFPYAMAEF